MFGKISIGFLALLAALVGATFIEKDLTFGSTLQGYTIQSAQPGSSINNIGLPASGDYYGCGNAASSILLGRETIIGNLDTANFNAPVGYQVISLGDTSGCSTITIQPADQKPVIAGTTTDFTTGIESMYIMRFTTAGTVDTSTFGAPNGYVLINAPAIGGGVPDDTFGNVVVLQPSNGYIVVGGSQIIDTSGNFQAVLTRTDTTGVLDPAFGTGGIATLLVTTSSFLNGLAMQLTEKTVMLLQTDITTPTVTIARFDTAGVLDPTFGTSGIFSTSALGPAVPQSIEVQTVGANADKLIVGASNANQMFFLRFTANGALDTTFGSSGIATITLNPLLTPTVASIDIANDGSDAILAGGSTGDGNSHVTKLLADGLPDTTFGSNGVQIIAEIVAGQPLSISSVAFDNNNLPIAGGLSDGNVMSMRLKPTSTPYIILTSPTTAESPLTTDQLYLSGQSSHAQQQVIVNIDGTPTARAVTNARGDWTAGLTAPLTAGSHVVVANLIFDVSTVLASDTATVTTA